MSTPKNSKPADKKNGAIPKKETKKGLKLLKKPIPLYIFILIFIPLFSVGFFVYSPHFYSPGSHNELRLLESNANKDVQGSESDTGLVVQKEKMLTPTKNKINSFLEQKNREDAFTSASVYLNDLSTGAQIDINPDELYDPASIMKVPCLIIYLKEV